jgi:hypothetical protein
MARLPRYVIGEMRIIAFITKASVIRYILGYLGEPISPPRLMQAHGPRLWDMHDAGPGETAPQARAARAPARALVRALNSRERPRWGTKL